MISVSGAKAIVEVVANDPTSRRKIESWLDSVVPDSWYAAGGIRNVGFWAQDLVKDHILDKVGVTDATDIWVHDECNSIADATSKAINKAKKGKSAGLRCIGNARAIIRDTSLGNNYAHTGTLITITNETPVVFDWHANLAIRNPVIYSDIKSFHLGKGGFTFEEFIARGDQQSPAEAV